MAWSFRSDHDDIQISARHNLTVVHVKAVCKCQHSALFSVRRHVFAIHLSDVFIGQQNHDDVCTFNSVIDFSDFEACFFYLGP